MTDLELLIEYLPFLIPLIILQFALAIYSAIHVYKHPTYKFGNQLVWLIVVLFISFIGPLIYFMFGRGDAND